MYYSRSTLASCCILGLYTRSGKKDNSLPLRVLPAPNTFLVFCRVDLWGGRKKKTKNENPKKQSQKQSKAMKSPPPPATVVPGSRMTSLCCLLKDASEHLVGFKPVQNCPGFAPGQQICFPMGLPTPLRLQSIQPESESYWCPCVHQRF